MSTHAEHPDRHGEAILAAYSHAASSPVAEWSYRHTEWFACVTVFLLTLTVSAPTLAAVLAVVVAVAMLIAGVALSLREAHGTCEQIIGEVQGRSESKAEIEEGKQG